MSLKLSILIGLISFGSALHGQNVEKCDGSIVQSTENRVGQLTRKNVKNFLLTFGKDCRVNVEFSQYSNEILFLILDKQTGLVIETIQKEKRRIEFDEILENLRTPIHDQINVKSLIAKVEETKTRSKSKDKIIAALKIAYFKSN